MLCYRDRTFCPYWEKCKDGVGCSRALTQEVKDGAIKWAGSGYPLVSVFASQPECFVIKETIK